MSKTLRATADGFYGGAHILKGATFIAHDEFGEAPEGETPEAKAAREAAQWFEEVDDRAATPGNVTAQETLEAVLKPAVPEVERVDVPLPEFHPTVATPDLGKVDQATQDAQLGDPSGTPVEASAQVSSTSDPKVAKSANERRADRKAADAKADSKAEVAAQKASDKAKDEGADLV